MFDLSSLYSQLKRDFALFCKVRSVLDTLLLIEKSPRSKLKVIQKVCKNVTAEDISECESKAPNYLRIDSDEEGELIVFSNMLKRHFTSESFRKNMMSSLEIDNMSLSKQANKNRLCIQNVTTDILSKPYRGMLPTRQYTSRREVFVVDTDFIDELKEMFPSQNIEDELNSIFCFFRDTPLSRKMSTNIRAFIKKWLSGDLLISARQAKKQNRISADDFYEELKKNGI